MLFEVATAVGEQLLSTPDVDWDSALKAAVIRQRRHFDAKIPSSLSKADLDAAIGVANNLAFMLDSVSRSYGELSMSPRIPGYQWISSGNGDFSAGLALIEVKCTSKRFSASDYRQVMMYWLLSYASAVEGRGAEWTHGVLLNPRLNRLVSFRFDDIVMLLGAGRSKVDVLEYFTSLIGDHNFRMLSSI